MNQKIFDKVKEDFAESSEGSFSIEIDIEVLNKTDEPTPGIYLQGSDMNYPVFISVQQLRAIADEAENVYNKENQSVRSTKLKK